MYQIVAQNEQKEYTFSQLQELFSGKWLYLVHAEFSNAHGLIKATPVIIADSELEGIEDGIYELYRSDYYGRKADADFTDRIMAVPSVLWSERI